MASRKNAKNKKTITPDTVLVLRTCAPDMISHSGFRWPESGPVECPDWDPNPRCGGGLHGFLWGEGKGDLLNWDPDARWLVVEVLASDVVDLDGKVKFPRGVVVHCGDRKSATELIQRPGKAVIGGTATAGYSGTATAGDCGIISIRWWYGDRYRLAIGYVGEDGIEPNTAYCVSGGKLFKKVAQ